LLSVCSFLARRRKAAVTDPGKRVYVLYLIYLVCVVVIHPEFVRLDSRWTFTVQLRLSTSTKLLMIRLTITCNALAQNVLKQRQELDSINLVPAVSFFTTGIHREDI
jgi:hypothetical protein